MAQREQTTSAPQGWEALPVELRHAVVMRWLPDRDLGACLLAARCFHVLTPRDLEARRYAYATVEGMCFAGDIRGLEYALRRRPAQEPINWAMCLLEAKILGRSSTVNWIVAHIPQPPHGRPFWNVAMGSRADAVLAMSALAAEYAAPAEPHKARGRLWAHMDEAKTHLLLVRMSYGASAADPLRGAVSFADHTPRKTRDIARVDEVVRANAEYRRCRAATDHIRACALQQTLVQTFRSDDVDTLIAYERLDDVVSLVTNPAATAGIPHWLAADLLGRAGAACAGAGRLALVQKIADSIDGPICPSNYRANQQKDILRGAAGGGHIYILEFAVARWPSCLLGADGIVARAAQAGHVDCVRWLCAHGFTCKDTSIWCGQRAGNVSALTYALVLNCKDMINALRHAIDIEQAATEAFHDAIAAGDLRVARLVCALWPLACGGDAVA